MLKLKEEKKFDHIIGEEYTITFGVYEEARAKEVAWEIANEYEGYLNANGHELDDQDKMNDIEAITNLHVGEYDFECLQAIDLMMFLRYTTTIGGEYIVGS